MSKALALTLRVFHEGQWWQLYCITFRDEAEDKTRSAWTYARNFEDAHALFAELAMTGQVTDCLAEVKR